MNTETPSLPKQVRPVGETLPYEVRNTRAGCHEILKDFVPVAVCSRPANARAICDLLNDSIRPTDEQQKIAQLQGALRDLLDCPQQDINQQTISYRNARQLLAP